jgi:uncharacterized protein (TIGR02300 family)
VRGVVKAEWGTKRICLSCGARFYDMNREPIVCPACSTALDPVVQSRPRRARAATKLVPVAAVADPVGIVPDEELEEEDEPVVIADDEEDDDAEDDGESAIEDVSELGDDDMADVIETDLDEEEGER